MLNSDYRYHPNQLCDTVRNHSGTEEECLLMQQFKTRMTELLGIQYPIMCGGMQNAANPELAVAVSEAGGLGITNISMYPDLKEFRSVLRAMRGMTKKPLAVNISMLPNIEIGENIFSYVDICAEEGINVIETSGKDPAPLAPRIHAAGMKLIHKVPMPRHAVRAEKSGADLVSIVGAEAAGHPSPDLVGTMIAVNKASRLVRIPVIAGGGICDGRSLLAALALGAEGAVMGTRFLATKECTISDNHKRWILDHGEKDTVLCQKAIRNMIRVAHTGAADDCLQLEQQPGVTLSDLMPVISGAVSKESYRTGDVETGMFPVGQDIALIEDLPTAKELMERIIREATEGTSRLNSMLAGG